MNVRTEGSLARQGWATLNKALGAILGVALLAGCTFIKSSAISGSALAASAMNGADSAVAAPPVVRRGFLGAFFRPNGAPPFGVFSVYSKQEAPEPTPAPSTRLFGQRGYCDVIAANGLSITSGYLVDAKKLSNITELGVSWTRTDPAPFWDDHSHVDPEHQFSFADFDSAQCALTRHHITPLIALENGPVVYSSNPGVTVPKEQAHYQTAADFAQWCTAVVEHERKTFTAVHRYSMPGNEVNSNAEMFPGGDAQIAEYTKACYKAVKRVDPKAFVYGLELNMDANADPAGMVKRLYDLGCRPRTCYDGLSAHMSLTYPIPSPKTPCHPSFGGEYGVRCLLDLQTAAHAPIHIIIGETGYFVPGSVPNEETKAKAVVAEMKVFAALSYIDGVNYANIDECDQYPTGFFVGGCLVDSLGKKLPGYFALRSLAATAF